MRKIMSVLALFSSLLASELMAQQRVVGYLVERQDERKETRWTLTEWLHIKERMKMMDLWLALFGEDKNKRIAPELSLSYERGESQAVLSSTEGDAFSLTGDRSLTEHGQVQFWFHNLVSSTTGLRTLSIDLGLEGRFANRFAHQALLSEELGKLGLSSRTGRTQQASLNFRLFGANVQDSGLVLKLGKYAHRSYWSASESRDAEGLYEGAELLLYLMPWLGLEGHWDLYQKNQSEDLGVNGWSRQGSAFVEFFNLRVGYGAQQAAWSYQAESWQRKASERERFFFVRLYF